MACRRPRNDGSITASSWDAWAGARTTPRHRAQSRDVLCIAPLHELSARLLIYCRRLHARLRSCMHECRAPNQKQGKNDRGVPEGCGVVPGGGGEKCSGRLGRRRQPNSIRCRASTSVWHGSQGPKEPRFTAMSAHCTSSTSAPVPPRARQRPPARSPLPSPGLSQQQDWGRGGAGGGCLENEPPPPKKSRVRATGRGGPGQPAPAARHSGARPPRRWRRAAHLQS